MNHERLKVHPGCLMVFVDETGHEEFADPNYPVFGFGGCAVPAFCCADVLERPWREMKERHFGGADVALHASDLRQPTPEQLEALGAFFRAKRFGRFAVIMCRDVSLPEGESPIQAMRGAVRDRWSELASRVDQRQWRSPALRGFGARESAHRKIFRPDNRPCGCAAHPCAQRLHREAIWARRARSGGFHRTRGRWSSSLASPRTERPSQGL
jgi:hypothetical protein